MLLDKDAPSIAPKHRPYRTMGPMFQIGLKPMDMAEWLDVGPDHAGFMAEKRRRLAGRPPLFYGSLPISLLPQAELRDLVAANLATHHPQSFELAGRQLRDCADDTVYDLDTQDDEPLEVLSRFVEEDFILFQKIDGQDVITAASNPYSSSGRIVSTVGRTMSFAHMPVPGLNAELGTRINRVMANIRTDGPVVRFNWFLTAIASRLFPSQPQEHSDKRDGDELVGMSRRLLAASQHEPNQTAALTAASILVQDHSRAGELLWMRVERQSFVRLPETGALAFGIHTYSDPLSALADDRESLQALQRLLGEYSADRLSYSALVEIKDPIMRWIEDRLV